VVKTGEEFGLALEQALYVWLYMQRLFKSNQLLQAGIVGAIDGAEPAAPQHLFDFIAILEHAPGSDHVTILFFPWARRAEP
jgi:hypothetical protein